MLEKILEKLNDMDKRFDGLENRLGGLETQVGEVLEITKALQHNQEVHGATLHNIESDVNKISGVLTGQAQLALAGLKKNIV